MRKTALLTISALITGTCVFAQTTSTPSSTARTTSFGLKTGINLAKYRFGSDENESSQVISAHFTGYADIPLSTSLSLQPGISVQGKGGEFDFIYQSVPATRKDNVIWLEVPLNLVGKIPFGGSGTNLYIGAGPYAGFAVTGTENTKINAGGNENKRNLEFGNEPEDDMRGIDFGINALAGIQLINGINLGAGYGLGLRDLHNSGTGGDNQKNNRVLSFSIGYQF